MPLPRPHTWLAALTAAGLMSLPATAQAFCEYKGVLYARTTVAQEYQDAEWVAKVRVLSGRTHWSDTEDSWSLYDLRVIEVYKGAPPETVRFLSYRNSGGFYFDIPFGGVDTGGEYLVFVNRITPAPDAPKAARGAVFVNYPCGQSKPWREVTADERAALKTLSAH